MVWWCGDDDGVPSLTLCHPGRTSLHTTLSTSSEIDRSGWELRSSSSSLALPPFGERVCRCWGRGEGWTCAMETELAIAASSHFSFSLSLSFQPFFSLGADRKTRSFCRAVVPPVARWSWRACSNGRRCGAGGYGGEWGGVLEARARQGHAF